jgi:hypothetical protein
MESSALERMEFISMEEMAIDIYFFDISFK